MTIKQTMKNMLRKAKVPAVAGLAALAIGCQDYANHSNTELSYTRDNLGRMDREFISDKINEIAVYTLFKDGKVMNYEVFSKVTGLFSPISQEHFNSPVWVEVSSSNHGYEVVESDGGSRVMINIPEDIAKGVLGKLSSYKTSNLGRNSLTDDDFKNLPIGGY